MTRITNRYALCFIILQFCLCVIQIPPFISTAVANPSGGRFRLVTISLDVRDYDGTPLQNALVRSFSEDYGIRVPNFNFNITNSQGKLTIRLMNGTWSFFVYGGDSYGWMKPGYAYFMCLLNQDLQSNMTFVLQPNEKTFLSFQDTNGTSINGKLNAIESKHAPIIVTWTAGTTSNGNVTLYSPKGIDMKILFQSLGISTGHILLRTVSSGSSTSIKADKTGLTKINLLTRDINGNPSAGTFYFNYDYFDIGDNTGMHPIEIVTNGQYVLYSSPTLVSVWSTLRSGWDFWHCVPQDYMLTSNSELTLQRGGPVSVGVHMMQDQTQIWLDVRDSFGNFYMDNGLPSPIPIRLTNGSGVVYDGSVRSFTDRLQKTYHVSDSIDYNITLGLETYGTFKLTGKLLSLPSILQFRTIISEHFNISVPDVGGKVADRFNTMASVFEQIYGAESVAIGRSLASKTKIEFMIAPFSAGFAGTNYVGMGSGFSLDGSYKTVPSTFIGVAAHELGHVFQLSSPFSPPGWFAGYFGEPSATWLDNKAVALILSSKHALYERGAHDNFFLDLLRGSPTTNLLIENIQFVLYYLEKWYGSKVLKSFADLWTFKKAGTLLANSGYNINESIVSVYSTIVNENLAPIFRQAGLNVLDNRIDSAMKVAAQLKSTSIFPLLSDFGLYYTNNDVMMVYPSENTIKPIGCSAASVSDWTASAFIYTKLGHVFEGLDTDFKFVNQTTGQARSATGVGVLTFGGPIVNPVVKYAENGMNPEDDRAPIRWRSVGGVYYFQLADGTNIPAASLPISVLNHDQDMFVIEVFKDADGRYMMLCYGFGWKGTYAAGKYFDRIIYPSLASYNVNWLIVKWNDTNGDGFVNAQEDGDTYILIAAGSEDYSLKWAGLKWRQYQGYWSVEGEELRQNETGVVSWAFAGNVSWTDYDLQIDVKFLQGAPEASIGFRSTNENNVYYFCLAGGAKLLTIAKIVGGVETYNIQTMIWNNPVYNQWYHAKVEIRGNRIKTYLDGSLIFDYTATDLPSSGRIGLRTFFTRTSFDNLVITTYN